jgi:hypothetical protein
MKNWLLLLFCLFLSPASADVYKWVDNDGNIHYSDQSPEEGAKPVELPKGVYYTPPPLPEGSEEGLEEGLEKEMAGQPGAVAYGELVITRPTMNEVIRSNEGIVTVEYTIDPALAAGDEFKIILDGLKHKGSIKSTSFVLTDINRGSHTLKVQAIREGVAVATSKSVIFHLLKESVIDPDSTSGVDNSEAFVPDYDADKPTGKEFDATETPDYGAETPDYSGESSYDPATTKIPTVKGGSQYKAGTTYTPNYNQKK